MDKKKLMKGLSCSFFRAHWFLKLRCAAHQRVELTITFVHVHRYLLFFLQHNTKTLSTVICRSNKNKVKSFENVEWNFFFWATSSRTIDYGETKRHFKTTAEREWISFCPMHDSENIHLYIKSQSFSNIAHCNDPRVNPE